MDWDDLNLSIAVVLFFPIWIIDMIIHPEHYDEFFRDEPIFTLGNP